jgi:hypothetical protein
VQVGRRGRLTVRALEPPVVPLERHVLVGVSIADSGMAPATEARGVFVVTGA